ncbi:MAG TPA: ABC transporter permease [Propionibacteriaceae bacterium]|nr:ABC transporter permease [Propionibacteriaceae bacterium]
MNGLWTFLRKELMEFVRTWRVWVLFGIVMFMAVSSPGMAKLMPVLFRSLEGSGMTITMPDPTWRDAYLQWTGNLGEVVLLAVVIMLGGLVAGEVKSGTALLVLTKPLSRSAFLTAKFLANSAFVVVAALLGSLITWVGTRLLFGEAPLEPLVAATAAWLLLGVCFVALMVLLSSLVRNSLAAAGLGFAVYMVASLASMWGPARRWSPIGLVNGPTSLATGEPVDLTWPIVTTVVLTGALLASALKLFGRREL